MMPQESDLLAASRAPAGHRVVRAALSVVLVGLMLYAVDVARVGQSVGGNACVLVRSALSTTTRIWLVM